jgi:uncharacterized protein with predicted RNA binding PUA domain
LEELRRIRSIADYQFGRGTGVGLFPKGVEIVHSKKTGRIRYIYLEGERLATMRPTDGLFSLSIAGAKRVVERARSMEYRVTARNDVSKYISEGGDLFAAHVVKAGNGIRSRDEVIVLDEDGKILAVGRAVLSGEEMKAFKRGVAVKVRRGNTEAS